MAAEIELVPAAESGALLDSVEVSADGRRLTFPVQLASETTYRLIVSVATAASGAGLGQVVVSGFATGATPVAPGSISGQVTFDDGTMPEGTVFAFNETGDLVGQASIDETGAYRMADLPAGSYQVFGDIFVEGIGQVSGGYDADGDRRPDPVDLAAGQDAPGIDIALSYTPPEPPSGPVNVGAGITLKLSRMEGKTLVDELYEVRAGEQFLVWVEATEVADLAAYQIAVGYDPTQVSFKRVEKSSQTKGHNILFKEGGKALFIAMPPSEGEVELSGAVLGDNPDLFVSGEGLLGVFRFVALESFSTAEFRLTRAILQSGPLEETATTEGVCVASREKQPPDSVEVVGPVKMDLDPADGNQGLRRKANVNAGDEVVLQLFAEGFENVTGYGMFVDYDTTQVSFVTSSLNKDFIPGAWDRVLDTGGQINVVMASFGGAQLAKTEGYLGQLSFATRDAFSDSTAFILNDLVLNLSSGTMDELPQRTFAWLIAGPSCGPDFNCDGVVDFKDFLAFAMAFDGTDSRFDLDGSGRVGFGDFVIFAQSFGKTVAD